MNHNGANFLKVPLHLVGWVVGRRGYKILELQQQASCKIWFDQCVKDNEPRILYFKNSGNRDVVLSAMRMIIEYLKTAPMFTDADLSVLIKEVTVAGMTSAEILSVWYPEGFTLEAPAGTVIDANGTELVSDPSAASMAGAPAVHTNIIDIPACKLAVLIGTDGWTLRRITRQSGARITINQNGKNSDTKRVIIYSTNKSAVDEASECVNRIIDSSEDDVNNKPNKRPNDNNGGKSSGSVISTTTNYIRQFFCGNPAAGSNNSGTTTPATVTTADPALDMAQAAAHARLASTGAIMNNNNNAHYMHNNNKNVNINANNNNNMRNMHAGAMSDPTAAYNMSAMQKAQQQHHFQVLQQQQQQQAFASGNISGLGLSDNLDFHSDITGTTMDTLSSLSGDLTGSGLGSYGNGNADNNNNGNSNNDGHYVYYVNNVPMVVKQVNTNNNNNTNPAVARQMLLRQQHQQQQAELAANMKGLSLGASVGNSYNNTNANNNNNNNGNRYNQPVSVPQQQYSGMDPTTMAALVQHQRKQQQQQQYQQQMNNVDTMTATRYQQFKQQQDMQMKTTPRNGHNNNMMGGNNRPSTSVMNMNAHNPNTVFNNINTAGMMSKQSNNNGSSIMNANANVYNNQQLSGGYDDDNNVSNAIFMQQQLQQQQLQQRQQAALLARSNAILAQQQQLQDNNNNNKYFDILMGANGDMSNGTMNNNININNANNNNIYAANNTTTSEVDEGGLDFDTMLMLCQSQSSAGYQHQVPTTTVSNDFVVTDYGNN